MKKTKLVTLSVILVLVSFSCNLFAMSGSPAEQEWKWKTSTPEQQGIDSEQLIGIFKQIKAQNLNLSSLLIIRNDHLVTEAYFPPYDQDTPHDLCSVTKSFLSSLIGIALEEGYLESIDQRVSEFFPQYYTEEMDLRAKEITLRDLLKMSAGYDISNNKEFYRSEQIIKRVIQRPLINEPGEKFRYDDFSSHLLAAVLAKTTGKKNLEFAQQHLFQPLGIKDVSWTKLRDGSYMGFSGLHLTPRQMAKFGLLYLNNGQWEGNQVVSADWVKKSTKKHIEVETEYIRRSVGNKYNYGYQWWTTEESYLAWGYGEQHIIVQPKLNMVIVTTAEDRSPSLFRTLRKSVVSAVKTDKPLEPNPEANEKLKEIITRVGNPKSEEVDSLPQKAAEISGKTYQLQKNEWGVKTIKFDFSGKDTAYLTIDGQKIKVGLDGVYRKSNIDYQPFVYDGDTAAKGKWSFVYDRDKAAAKGKWSGERTFLLRLNLIAETEFSWKIYFKNNELKAFITDLAGDRSIVLEGKY